MNKITKRKYSDGATKWYKNGKLHREEGPAIEWADGPKEWYKNGQRHREDGPAIEYCNGKEWWVNGQYHREDGPAVEYINGHKEYWINGEEMSAVEFLLKVGKDPISKLKADSTIDSKSEGCVVSKKDLQTLLNLLDRLRENK